MTLFTPVLDVKRTPYCGPTSVAALTGVPYSRIDKLLRRCRRGGYRDRRGRRIPIRGTYTWEIVNVLKNLGCKVTEMTHPEGTFGRFCRDTAHINAAYLVEVTGHFMATYKGTLCDTSNLAPVQIDGYQHASRRVRRAWRVDAPATPMYTTADTQAVRPTKPEPNIREVRAANVAAQIKKWDTKRKRAETALRKLRKRERYYARVGHSAEPRFARSSDQGEARPSPA